MKRYLLFFLILSSFSFSVVAQVYQWVDEHGVTHFSESPRGTPGDTYPVTQDKEQTGNTEVNVQPSEKKQLPEKKPEKLATMPKQGWPECNSSLCDKVKKIDVDCTSQDCTDAVRFSSDCKTIFCLSEQIDFEKKVDAELQQLANKNKVEKEPETPVQQEKEILSDKEVLEKCKKERNVRCRYNLEYYRTIYNGTNEERKEALQELRKARSARKDKKE